SFYPSDVSLAPNYANLYPILGTNDDLLLNDVISFDVRLLVSADPTLPLSPSAKFIDLFDPFWTSYCSYSSHPSFGDTGGSPTKPRVFDTWSRAVEGADNYSAWQTPGTSTSIPIYQTSATSPPISIRAIQVVIRVWDFKTQQTRQVTIVQDL